MKSRLWKMQSDKGDLEEKSQELLHTLLFCERMWLESPECRIAKLGCLFEPGEKFAFQDY
jgi:hypothetical protein